MTLTQVMLAALLSVDGSKDRPCVDEPLALEPIRPLAKLRVIRLPTLEEEPRLAPDRRFANKRLDIDMKDADVHNVLRLLAEVGQQNIVTSDDVSGRVTLRMKNARWEDVLAAVTRIKQLSYDWQGNMIFVERQEKK